MKRVTGCSDSDLVPHASGDIVRRRRGADHADPHARPHAGVAVLLRRRPARRRRHAVPRRLRAHRPSRRRSRALYESLTQKLARRARRRRPLPRPLYSPAPSAPLGEVRAAQLRVPPAHARAVDDDVRQRRFWPTHVADARGAWRSDPFCYVTTTGQRQRQAATGSRSGSRLPTPEADTIYLLAGGRDRERLGAQPRREIRAARSSIGAGHVRRLRARVDRRRRPTDGAARQLVLREVPRRADDLESAGADEALPVAIDLTSASVEQHRAAPAARGTRSPRSPPRRVRVGVEAQVRQSVEDRVEPDPQLEPREVHPEALVLAGAEREVVLHRPAEPPLVGVVPARPRRGWPSR